MQSSGPSSPATLNVAGLRFSWPGAPRPVLDIPALSLAPGESLFLRGPSGCGKSTLLTAIAGATDIPGGAVRVAGVDVGTLRGGARDRFRADHVGFIHQILNLVPWLSARENVLLPCRFSATRRDRAGPDAGAAADRLLDALGLGDEGLAGKRASALSVGQQQRVASARALIGTPELILADEPTSALDEEARDAFVSLLRSECAAANASLLFVSHDRALEHRFDRALEFSEVNRFGGGPA